MSSSSEYLRHLGSLLLVSILCGGCSPPPARTAPQEETPEPEPESGPSAIPWAEGERPKDAASTTREVSEQPGSADDPIILDDPSASDGIVSPDAQRCTGKAPPGLRADVQVRAADIKKCGDELPPGQEKMSGELKFTLRVKADGSVSTVSVLSDTLSVPQVQSCAESILKQPFEVGPVGGCVQFIIPLSFDAERTESAEGS